MDLEQFKKDCLRTESKIDRAQTSKPFLSSIMKQLVIDSDILDVLKKNIYYNREIDTDDIMYKLDIQSATAKFSKEYVEELEDSTQDKIDIDPRLLHGVIGIATEGGELIQSLIESNALGTSTKGVPDRTNILEELGDVAWYMSIVIDALDSDWDTVLNTVINKLKKRYPDKYSDEYANNRDLNTERQVLEDNINAVEKIDK